MIRQDIRLGNYNINSSDKSANYKFIVDLYKHGVDMPNQVWKNYVMFRKYELINQTARDTDLYLIDRDIYEEYENRDILVWPVTTNNFLGFSNKAVNYNFNYDGYNIEYNSIDEICGDEVYRLFDSEGNETKIPVDKVRIYHPHNLKTTNSLIYIKTTVASINVHLLVAPYNIYKTNAETEFIEDNLYYSEYIEVEIPNVEYLFGGQVYFEDNLSQTTIGGMDENGPLLLLDTADGSIICLFGNVDDPEYRNILYTTDDGVSDQYRKLVITNEDHILTSLRLLSFPYKLEERTYVNADTKDGLSGKYYIKKYVPDLIGNMVQNYVTYPIQIMLYPYLYIDETTNLYIEDDNLTSNSDVFYSETLINIESEFGFELGKPSIINKFTFPDKNKFNNFREAYQYYFQVDLNDYNNIVSYDEEDDDPDDWVEEKQCGFELKLFADYKMTNEVTKFYYEIGNPEENLDNFSFELRKIFNNWVQLPEVLICRCRFIDKYLGNVITGNPVYISKENFKYLLNTEEDKLNIIGEQAKLTKLDEMDLTKTNFIDKVTCVIRKVDESTKQIATEQRESRVLYKPVFYRTQDLQNIIIRQGLKQNIGIALAEYMTKVNTFKLLLNDTQYIEIARNDIYVIFSVDASGFEQGSTGTYHISNQDDEYISSGNYNVI